MIDMALELQENQFPSELSVSIASNYGNFVSEMAPGGNYD